MSSNKRALRSSATATPSSSSTTPSPSNSIPNPLNITPRTSTSLRRSDIKFIRPGSKLPFLEPSSLRLLRSKQRSLALHASATVSSIPAQTTSGPSPSLQTALASTLIFASYEAGTAVCISSEGWVLTCAHCFGDTEEECLEGQKQPRWLLFYTGLAVLVECRAFDAKRDLALLKIVAIESSEGKDGDVISLSWVPLSSRPLAVKMDIVCIGQPGKDDLESKTGGRTKYHLVEISEGRFRGLVPDADPQDNSEIGALKHDAWTYWGHSGAPLVRKDDGTLIGMHSSWDDQTAMRHGIPLVAIKSFLEQQRDLIGTIE